MKKAVFFLTMTIILAACQPSDKAANEMNLIREETMENVITRLTGAHEARHHDRIKQGVLQTARLWRVSDGSEKDFETFCLESFIGSEEELDLVFDRLSHYFEHLYGFMNRISLELNRQIHEDRGPIHKVDQLFGAYSPAAHVIDDFYNNKLAFIITLNFPSYSLDEKNSLGINWTPREWGYARLGDYFTERIPPVLLQELNQVYSAGRLYISEYNIFAGKLVNDQGQTLFPENMKLLAHWNLRDEIKSNYGQPGGLDKKEMLYQVMLRIINQDIPRQVINNPDYTWNPFSNEVWENGQAVEMDPEDVVRYEHLLANFKAIQKTDPYYPEMDTYIKRRFEGSMEIPQEEVEALFREYAASPLLRELGKLISLRLGRELRPFDLWYNGFKGGNKLSEEQLTAITKSRYPHADAFNRDLPRFLTDLGFGQEQSAFIASHIEVDPARGSGHAWRTSMKSMPSHLRTRISSDGMDYKGYNIAIHEYGHNVEQTISTHYVDNYFISGIPNTAFTEALAFMFQKRDLELLGISHDDPMKETFEILDVFWDNYEMMGVSLVDMEVWKWMYANPDANAHQLKEAVVRIAKEIWNEYFADVFGDRDIPLLAIYSHMIQSPLYLSNYPYGRLIMFQLEEFMQDKELAGETLRIFSLGRLTPRHWMNQAVGQQISNQPLFAAVEKALQSLADN
jgi:hypothetical protein